MTLWAAGSSAPQQLAQARTDAEGHFAFESVAAPGSDVSLYLTAKGGHSGADKSGGDNPALALLTVLGNQPPSHVTINEMTTVASVWTHAQFIDGDAIQGHALGLRIAAGNVPNFVDLQTGGGESPSRTPSTAARRQPWPILPHWPICWPVAPRGWPSRRAPSSSRTRRRPRKAPTDTLTAAQSIARYPWRQPEQLFALLDTFYPVPQGKNLRPVPFMPYLNYAPSAWVLPLKFDGGGYRAGGKAMFDSEGNLWVGDNFTIGWQGQDSLWEGHATKFAPIRREFGGVAFPK